jgi:hypothetical protein
MSGFLSAQQGRRRDLFLAFSLFSRLVFPGLIHLNGDRDEKLSVPDKSLRYP